MPEVIIDHAALEALREVGGDDFVVEMISTFCDETAQLLQQLKNALAESDTEKFRRMAHSIKSSSNTLGATQLSVQAKELERLAKENRLADAGPLIPTFEAEFAKVDGELRRIAAQ